MKTQCVDKVVGDILASWRYDISGIFPEMRGDYEAHFAECEHCRARRKLHRTIDFTLIGLATFSAFVFLVAFAVIRQLKPQHAFILEVGSLAGFALSALIWLGVAVATPAPIVAVQAARVSARKVHDKLPEKIRERIPEELWVRIAGE
jgi:anti-sigma factor RsiW